MCGDGCGDIYGEGSGLWGENVEERSESGGECGRSLIEGVGGECWRSLSKCGGGYMSVWGVEGEVLG